MREQKIRKSHRVTVVFRTAVDDEREESGEVTNTGDGYFDIQQGAGRPTFRIRIEDNQVDLISTKSDTYVEQFGTNPRVKEKNSD